MKSDYWVYASPGVDPAVPAALMVWQDGQGLVGDYSRMPPLHRHRKPGRAETAAAHRARDDLARPIARRPRHALHRVRHGERPLPALPDGGGAARGGEDLQTASGRLQPRHRRGILRRHLRVQRRVAHARQVQPRAFRRGQLHVHPVAPAGEAGGRQRVSLQGAQRAQAQYPHLDERRRRRPREQPRLLADAEHPDGQFAEAHGRTISTSASAPRRTAARRPPLDLPESLTWLWRDYDPEKTSAGIPHGARRKKRSLFSA